MDTAVETAKKPKRQKVDRGYSISERTSVHITADTVKLAAKHAAAASPADTIQIRDWFDERQPYLHIRQRGKSVKWYCRFRNQSALLGSALNERGRSGYLSVAGAREEASRVYVNGNPSSGTAAAAQGATSWTWTDASAAYQASLKEVRETKAGREQHPSRGTQDDVRLSLGKPSIANWGSLSINKLNRNMVEDAIEVIHKANGHRAASKSLTYVCAALNYATRMSRQSGITHDTTWWTKIFPPKRTPTERENAKAKKAKLIDNKTYYSVDHLGELLVAHEKFCAGRTGNEQISPGIRWGIWWLAFTANRRRTPTVLRRKELQADTRGRTGWGIAKWADDEMKAQTEFWLPLPPVVWAVAKASIADWETIVNKSASPAKQETLWVFSSTRRVGRDPDNTDVAVNASSLSHYLEDLRAWDKFPKQIAKREDDTITTVEFTLHLARSVVGNWLDNNATLPSSASSLILAHAAENDETASGVSKTTKRFYLTGQKMDIKAVAMEAWSKAVMAAFKKAGGKTLPMLRHM